MKILIVLFLSLTFAVFLSCSAQETAALRANSKAESNSKTAERRTPVLLELFTSEGCSTCPPAERVLASLQNEQPNPNAEIITLALHVDYWNRAGWTDEFSSPLYSQRQEIYADRFKIGQVFTPQMVVDGTKQFVGSNLDEANKAINESAKTQKATVGLSFSEDKLKIKISDLPKHENAAVFVAIAEDDLSRDVKGGENSGRTLQHASVVRSLKPVGRVLAAENNFEIEIAPEIEASWKQENLKFVIFLQENQSRRILGVNVIKKS